MSKHTSGPVHGAAGSWQRTLACPCSPWCLHAWLTETDMLWSREAIKVSKDIRNKWLLRWLECIPRLSYVMLFIRSNPSFWFMESSQLQGDIWKACLPFLVTWLNLSLLNGPGVTFWNSTWQKKWLHFSIYITVFHQFIHIATTLHPGQQCHIIISSNIKAWCFRLTVFYYYVVFFWNAGVNFCRVLIKKTRRKKTSLWVYLNDPLNKLPVNTNIVLFHVNEKHANVDRLLVHVRICCNYKIASLINIRALMSGNASMSRLSMLQASICHEVKGVRRAFVNVYFELIGVVDLTVFQRLQLVLNPNLLNFQNWVKRKCYCSIDCLLKSNLSVRVM